MIVAGMAMVSGCDRGGDARTAEGPATAPVPGGPAVEHVPRAYYPRPEDEDFWETLNRADAGHHFLLHVFPRIRTPAEGPWTVTFISPEGQEIDRHPGLRVDTATGYITFLCRTQSFGPGDWTIRLDLDEGGMTAGANQRIFRFRVEG